VKPVIEALGGRVEVCAVRRVPATKEGIAACVRRDWLRHARCTTTIVHECRIPQVAEQALLFTKVPACMSISIDEQNIQPLEPNATNKDNTAGPPHTDSRGNVGEPGEEALAVLRGRAVLIRGHDENAHVGLALRRA
jgi:hypothetical protein